MDDDRCLSMVPRLGDADDAASLRSMVVLIALLLRASKCVCVCV